MSKRQVRQEEEKKSSQAIKIDPLGSKFSEESGCSGGSVTDQEVAISLLKSQFTLGKNFGDLKPRKLRVLVANDEAF